MEAVNSIKRNWTDSEEQNLMHENSDKWHESLQTEGHILSMPWSFEIMEITLHSQSATD